MVTTNENIFYKILVISDYQSISHTRAEAEVFVKLAALGHTVHIITVKGADYTDRFRAAGIEVHDVHPTKKFSIPFIKSLRKLVIDNQYDFVHAFNSKGLTNTIWALMGLKAKLITYRGYAGQTHWYDPVMYLKYFHPRVDHIVCVSKNIEDILAQNMIGGRKKLSTIPKGHDLAWYQDIVPVDRASLGIPEDAVLVCFLANNRPFKGLRYLIEATHLLSKELPLHFLFVGQGYDDPETIQSMNESPFSDRFYKAGFQKNSLPFLATCDCLISTSTHGEGLSKVIVESMSLGIAPIITDIGGNEGLLEDGNSGWMIPIKDPQAIATALTNMASDKSERERRGKNAKEHIRQHFNIDRSVELFLEMYWRITKKGERLKVNGKLRK